MARRKVKKLIGGASDAYRAWHDRKEEAVEETVSYVENETSLVVTAVFLILSICLWLIAIYRSQAVVDIIYFQGFYYPLLVVFVISYFTFFHGSKIVFRPSREEIEDDTSAFALFSACRRRESRSLASIALSIVQMLILAAIVASQDWTLPNK